MHKKSPEEAVTSLHDLSAVDLIAGYRAKQFSPSEVLEDVLGHVAAWEPHLKALYAFEPTGKRVSMMRANMLAPIGRILSSSTKPGLCTGTEPS